MKNFVLGLKVPKKINHLYCELERANKQKEFFSNS